MRDVFWIESSHQPRSKLAIVLRPRGDQWLEDEILRLKNSGVQTLVSMLEDWEADSLGLSDEANAADRAGLNFLSYPIPDTMTPLDLVGFRGFINALADRLRAGQGIGVHCRGSIGRSTIAAACCLIHLGWKPGDALSAIEAARGCRVPDTRQQREWILAYKALR